MELVYPATTKSEMMFLFHRTVSTLGWPCMGFFCQELFETSQLAMIGLS